MNARTTHVGTPPGYRAGQPILGDPAELAARLLEALQTGDPQALSKLLASTIELQLPQAIAPGGEIRGPEHICRRAAELRAFFSEISYVNPQIRAYHKRATLSAQLIGAFADNREHDIPFSIVLEAEAGRIKRAAIQADAGLILRTLVSRPPA